MGGNNTTKEQGQTTLRVSNSNQTRIGEITVDVFTGLGGNYKRRETELINIQIDGKIWSGTFADLSKKLFSVILIILSLSFAGYAQTATKTPDGNYIAAKNQATGKQDKPTGKTYTDAKGIVYPLLISVNGKLYYMRTSKTGNVYKAYLKVN
jgi:hypothetical protein